MKKLIGLMLLTVFLTACDPNLREENAQLKKALAEQQGSRQADIDALERAAAVAEACDWLVPVCSDSYTKLGRTAAQNGWIGGGKTLFLLKTMKLTAFAAALGAFLGVFWWLLRVWVHPAEKMRQNALKQAEEERQKMQEMREQMAQALEDTQKRRNEVTQNAEKLAAQARAEVERLEELIEQRSNDVTELDKQINVMQAKADELKALLEARETAKRLTEGL